MGGWGLAVHLVEPEGGERSVASLVGSGRAVIATEEERRGEAEGD